MIAVYDWYTLPSRTESGEIVVVNLKARVSYQIRARLSDETCIRLKQRNIHDPIEAWVSPRPPSAMRATSFVRWDVMAADHDREAELWFGFKVGASDEKRFEWVVLQQIPEGGVTGSRLPIEIWRWQREQEASQFIRLRRRFTNRDRRTPRSMRSRSEPAS